MRKDKKEIFELSEAINRDYQIQFCQALMTKLGYMKNILGDGDYAQVYESLRKTNCYKQIQSEKTKNLSFFAAMKRCE